MTAPTTVTREQILAAVEAGEEATIELLQELIRTPSVNPWFGDPAEISGEAPVQAVFERRLRELGADEIDVWEPSADELAHRADGPGYYPGRDFTGRPNVVARFKGTDPDAPAFMIQGHCDVVSVGSLWTEDPFGGARKDGKIYGRGTVDMKGGMAAALGGLAALKAAGVRLRNDLIIASVADEEAGGMGTLALVDRGYVAPLGTIVPEATDLNIAPLCRGILWGEVVLHGRAGHIELEKKPWQEGGAVDAIAYGHRLLDAIRAKNAEWAADPVKNHRYLPIPCQIHVAQIDAGEYPTTYASRCAIRFNAQYLPGQKDAHGLGSVVKAELEELFTTFVTDDDWFTANPPTITWLVDADCGETPDTEAVVQRTLAHAREVGIASDLQGCMSHTDMGLMIDSGSPTINFGPGHMGVAHQADENVEEADLLAATKVFALTIADICG
ncbi:M20/M25/M40 family metallo-hydrolase [Blastococcus haudaquaticus]|uniref:Acetylornithine deacetylase n=1 Tax=Blastococcus haudaquaticus TaxID=1938745 RepID=A0A286H169_9ACTN|nr:M20/M25/M40 family metallo-hydrolase [Blastococcus haudaquaticus]SOE01491.1 acetylornithine deacetylase [Blastococcus haudaquaticus]